MQACIAENFPFVFCCQCIYFEVFCTFLSPDFSFHILARPYFWDPPQPYSIAGMYCLVLSHINDIPIYPVPFGNYEKLYQICPFAWLVSRTNGFYACRLGYWYCIYIMLTSFTLLLIPLPSDSYFTINLIISLRYICQGWWLVERKSRKNKKLNNNQTRQWS